MKKKLTLLRCCSVLLLFLITVTFNSCKKEKEIITPKQPPKGVEAKLQKITYDEFLRNVGINKLGPLKQKLQNASSGNSLLSINDGDDLGKLAIYTNNIQKVVANGDTSYVFAMGLSSPRAISFRNLTIQKDKQGKTSAFITTYTPTEEWIKARKAKKSIAFKGDMSFATIDLASVTLSEALSIKAVQSKGKTMSAGNKTMNLQTVCTTYAIYESVAYGCSSGGHMPWDDTCPWNTPGYPIQDGHYAAGWETINSVRTVCVDIEMNTGSGGGSGGTGGSGSTTPNPPEGYDPCDCNTPPPNGSQSAKTMSTGSKLMVIPANCCDGETTPPAYQFTAEDLEILKEIKLEDAIDDQITVLDPACYGTGRTGNVKWKGTAEHWLIQYDYAVYNEHALREYSIPNAGPSGSARGYADIANMATGELFEIKPNNFQGTTDGAAEVTNYVAKASQSCKTTSGAPFSKGLVYTPRYFKHPYISGKILKSELNQAGVIVYSTIETQDVPQPVPVLLPQTLANRLKDFVRTLMQNQADMERKILAFLRVNPQLVPYLKAAAVGIVIGTIIEDILTGGVGIADDWASFVAARTIYRLALKIP